MGRVLGAVAGEKKAEAAKAAILAKFPQAKIDFEDAGSTPGRVSVVLNSNVLAVGEPNVEAMISIVNANR